MTAIDYLFNELWEAPKDKLTWHSLLDKAKELERQQIIEAYNEGEIFPQSYLHSKDYYNKTYSK